MDSLIAAQIQGAQLKAAQNAPAMPRPTGGSDAEIRQAAKEFEAVFLAQMLKPIFDGLETDGPFGGGQAEETYRGLLVEEYGKAIAQAGGVGIADQVAREMLKLQEVAR